ncbi:hypothetical protein LTR53_017973, partial [Teratosphaeriaceae sp. CCFEE 6253]
MFTRAYQRFNAAEEVRRDARTLRMVLEDEGRAGGEAEAARLAELEGRGDDNWGVPIPHGSPVPATADLVDTTPELPRELADYYALLRRQGWTQRATGEPAQAAQFLSDPIHTAGQHQQAEHRSPAGAIVEIDSTHAAARDDFPRSMLHGIALTGQHARPTLVDDFTTLEGIAGAEWRLDVHHAIEYILHVRSPDEITPIDVSELVNMREQATLGALTDDQRSQLLDILKMPRVIWGSGLVEARIRARRREGVAVELVGARTTAEDTQAWLDQTELMAEAYQMSAEVRQQGPGLNGPERLRMLYRLQAGDRTLEDVVNLQHMLRSTATLDIASRVHHTAATGIDSVLATGMRQTLEQHRRAAAREGDRSREELNAQRQSTRSLAVAAGRTAMQTGPDALLQRMASQSAETQAAYERLVANGWAPDGDTPDERSLRQSIYRPFHAFTSRSTSDSEPEPGEEELQGLDATDTGRPAPMSEEEMKVDMHCKICYYQLAEIACLP